MFQFAITREARTTVVLYANYRGWCEENGVGPAGRPKMRDVIMTYRPSVLANRQRMVDADAGEVKLVWGLVGIRLRTPADDFPEDDRTPNDPVDPLLPDTGYPQDDAVCEGDPVNSENISDKEETDNKARDSVVESFSPHDWIIGSDRLRILCMVSICTQIRCQ